MFVGDEREVVCEMRGYREELEVTTDGHEMPCFFVWRGRRYRVTQVLENWHEQLPWWRLAVLSDASDAPGSEVGAIPGSHWGLRYETEQRVWRVEAAAGRLASTGVFEMAHTEGGWRLRRVSD